MSLEVITHLGVSDKAKDTYPIISHTGVTSKLIQRKIFPQRKAITDSLLKLMAHQMERCEDWIHYHIEINRDIQTHVKYIITKDLRNTRRRLLNIVS